MTKTRTRRRNGFVEPEDVFYYFMHGNPPVSGCWDWPSNTDGRGYGHFSWNRRWIGAHRMSHEIFIGPIPTGLNVLHTCDRKICVQPAHLYAGTQTDNTRDAMKRGQIPTPAPYAKLTDLDVLIIRASEASHEELGKIFGVSSSHIYNVRAGFKRTKCPI